MNLDIRFDFQRRDRLGCIEAIWGQDKSIDQLKKSELAWTTKVKEIENNNFDYEVLYENDILNPWKLIIRK